LESSQVASASYGTFTVFEASSCGLSRLEASSVDPQQLFLIESTSEALEHHSGEGSDVGVFVGVGAFTMVP